MRAAAAREAAQRDAAAAGAYLDDTDEVAVAPRRRGPSIRFVLLASFLLLLTVAVVGSVLLWQRVGRFNDSVSSASAMSFDLFGPLGGEERVNVAFFGYGGPEHTKGTYLADSIQILSIDPQADTTTLIPIPRDFWVEGLPQIPDNGKINEAFAIGQIDGGIDGAGSFATEILSEVTGLRVDYWLAVDFAAFSEMVDAVGGVTVRNPRAFRYTWSAVAYRAGHFRHGSFERGRIRLNGEEALSYARARYTNKPRESSDFARSARQARVLRALQHELGQGGIGAIGPGLAMMDALEGRMRTNLSAIDLFLLSGHLRVDRRIEMKEGKVLEATSNTIGQYILIPVGQATSTDYEPIRQFLRTELAKPIPTPTPMPSGDS